MTHDFLVRRAILDIINHGGLNICADIPGFPAPTKIGWKASGDGHIPDITATLFGGEFVFEVETDDSVLSDHTSQQLELFGAYAAEHQKVCCLVVPSLSYFRAMIAVHRASHLINIIRY